MDPVVVYARRCVQNGSDSLGLKALEDSLLELEAAPHRSIWAGVLLCIGGVCFQSIVLNFRVASAFVSILG
jgi:hypothetical protein